MIRRSASTVEFAMAPDEATEPMAAGGELRLVGHTAITGNALRAAVLGANDGLVSNFSLVMGVAGASVGNAPVVVAGVAGLLAGSFSMALGEWLSVRSSRELYANQLFLTAGAVDAVGRDDDGRGPDDLNGAAWTAAITSFVLFATGAIVPLAPFLVISGLGAIAVSAVLAGTALFLFGAAITVMTGRNPVLSGLRQLGFGFIAAVITFGIGSLLGTTVV